MSWELSHLPPNFDVTLAYLLMNCRFPTTYQIRNIIKVQHISGAVIKTWTRAFCVFHCLLL